MDDPVAPPTYRNATEADIVAEHAVFVAAEGALLERHGFGWSEPPPVERIAAGLRHLLRHDGERCFVAEIDGRVVGYSAAWVRGDTSFLAALFIEPARQGLGIGRRLMELALAGAPPRCMTISDTIQPISNALYAKHGLLPTTPILEFRGPATAEAPPDLTASEPAAADLARLDRAAYGFDRAVDHAFWTSQAAGTVWRRDGGPVAYAYSWPNGRIGPIAGLDETGASAALQAELARRPDAWLEIPGTSRSLVRAALAAGMRLVAPPGLLLTSDGVRPPRTLAIASYGLL